MKSVTSRVLLTGVLVASAAGWIGVQNAPGAGPQAAAGTTSPALTAQPGVRDRTAWQPSPIPSTSAAGSVVQSVGSGTSSSATGQGAAAQPGVRDRSAWQPSPVPSQAQTARPAAPEADAAAVALAQLPPAVPAAVAGGPAVQTPSALARFGEWLRALFVRADRSAKTGSATIVKVPVGAAAAAAVDAANDPVIPYSSLFTLETLDQLYGDTMPAQLGEWRIGSFYSRALGRESSYMAWVPPGYAASNRSYPTLYLLHGVGSPEAFGVEEWLGYALTEDLDRMLALGLIEPMIVVLPSGEQSYWINHANGGARWADSVAVDLVKHVDATFRTEATRERRAIGGLSMGGHGALQLAYNHPETFSIAGAHSPTIRPYETSPEFFGDPAWFARYDPVSLASTSDAARRVVTWIDVGADDPWRAAAQTLRDVLTARRAPVEYSVLEGEHEGWYWKYYLPEYLHFYSDALHATARTAGGAPVVANQLLTAASVSSATISGS